MPSRLPAYLSIFPPSPRAKERTLKSHLLQRWSCRVRCAAKSVPLWFLLHNIRRPFLRLTWSPRGESDTIKVFELFLWEDHPEEDCTCRRDGYPGGRSCGGSCSGLC